MILLNQGIQDPTMIGVEGLKGLQSAAQQNQPKSIYIPSIEEAKQMNVLGRDLRSGLEGVQTPQGFGKSVYDQRVSNLTEVQNLQDFRANEQPGMLKLLNGIGKGIALAGTTFLDGTVGLVAGIANIPDKGLAGLWDNNVSNALNDLNKKMEEWLPNYRTVEEEQSPWYENLGTMNFWADSFIKNLGFTVGAYYSGAAWTKALKAAGALKGALSAEVVGSLTSVINEGRIEATHNVGDWKQLQAQQIADARDKALSQLLPDSPLYAANVALINQSYDKQMKELDERASSMGNGILLANTILLFYNNFKTYGKLYAQGFKNAERKLLSDRVVKDGANYVWNDVTKKRALANGLRTGVREGLEEMNQALISESAGYMQTPDSPDAYYKAMIDPDADLQTSQFFDAVTRGFVNTYGNGQRWEEGVIGALTGLLGMPTFGRINNSGTETYLGKNKWIGLSGGLFGEFKSADFANAEGSEAVRIMNNYAEKIRDQKGHFVQGQSFANAMDGWSAENNAFEYKNAEDNDDFAAISAYAKVGRLSDLKDLVNQDFENISDDQLVEIANFTSESQTDPTKPVYGGWRNSDGSLMSDTEEGRQRMREKLVNQRNSILKNIDAYEESVETVRAITNNAQQISEDQINELAWLHWKIGRFKDRFNELKEENAPLFKAYLDGIHEYINALNEAESEEAAIHEVFVREDPEYYTNDRDYEEGLKETNKVRKALTNMASFIDKLQTTNEPLSLALLMSDKEFKKYVGEIFSEQNFDFFTMLGNGNLPYAQANKLFNDLQDLSKMIIASEQFNERYKEFVEDPMKLIENRNKQEKKAQKKRDAAAAENLAQKLDENFDEAIATGDIDDIEKQLKDAPEITPKIQEQIEKVEKFKTLESLKDRIIKSVNTSDASPETKTDVKKLLDLIDSLDDLFAFDSAVYTNYKNLYREDDASLFGKTNDNIKSLLEDRLNLAKAYIDLARKDIATEDARLEEVGDAPGGIVDALEEQLPEDTGNDPTTKLEASLTAGETATTSVPEAELNYFEANLTNSDLLDKYKNDIQAVISLIIDNLNKGKSISEIEKALELNDSYNKLAKGPNSSLISGLVQQYILDKTSASKDDNPINTTDANTEEVDRAISQDNDNIIVEDTNNKNKQYWSPIQSMLPIHIAKNSTEKLKKFYELVGLNGYTGYTAAQEKYIKAVGKYLDEKGAWRRIDSGLVKPNEEIHFAVDPKLNEDAGAFVILIVDKEGNVLGNLPADVNNSGEVLDKTFTTYVGLREFTDAVKDAYNEEDRADALWVMPGAVTHINKWMIGKVLFTDSKIPATEVFTKKNSAGETEVSVPTLAVGAVNKGGQVRVVRDSNRRQDTAEDNSILKPLSVRNGQPYVLFPTGNNASGRRFVAVPVIMGKVTTASTQLNDIARSRLADVFKLKYNASPTNIGKAKLALQEIIGGKFAIQVSGVATSEDIENSTVSVLHTNITLSIKDKDGKWKQAFKGVIDNQEDVLNAIEAAMSYFSDNSVPYQMSLKYINQKIEGKDYNPIILPHILIDTQPEVLNTVSNWFTLKPLQQKDGKWEEQATISPKSTGVNPIHPRPNPSTTSSSLYNFVYKGVNCVIDTSNWNDLYFPKADNSTGHATVYGEGGKINKQSAIAAAHAYGLFYHQDMKSPYKTQWGMYNPVTGTFIEQQEAPKKEAPTTETRGNTEALTKKAKELGLISEKLDEKVWDALNDADKSSVVNGRDPDTIFEEVKRAYDARTKTFKWSQFGIKNAAEFIKQIENAPFRVQDQEYFEKWNAEEEIKWLGKVLPQFNTEDRLQIVNGIIKVASSTEPQYAWGQFKKGVMYIYEGAAKGTLYHEAFHAVTHTLLTSTELSSLYSAAKTKYGNKSRVALEEDLAEDFRKYVQYEEDPNVGTLTRIFRKLKHFIQTLFGKDRYIDSIFYNAARGKFADRKANKTEAERNREINVDIDFQIDALENEIVEAEKALREDKGAPEEVSDLYKRWRKAREYKGIRIKQFDEDVEDWLIDNNLEDVAEPTAIYNRYFDRMDAGYVAAFSKEKIDRNAKILYAQHYQQAKQRIGDLKEELRRLKRDRESVISEMALEEQEMNDYGTIKAYHMFTTSYENLSEDLQEMISAKDITEDEYNDMSLEERDQMLFCR